MDGVKTGRRRLFAQRYHELHDFLQVYQVLCLSSFMSIIFYLLFAEICTTVEMTKNTCRTNGGVGGLRWKAGLPKWLWLIDQRQTQGSPNLEHDLQQTWLVIQWEPQQLGGTYGNVYVAYRPIAWRTIPFCLNLDRVLLCGHVWSHQACTVQ